jgi:SAM-dependent methyltransferase
VTVGYPRPVEGIRSSAELATAGAATPPPTYVDARAEFAFRFLAGEGLEIGALARPLALPAWAKARNVDRMATADLRAAYEELGDAELAEVDVVDDGERLETVAADSQDFIVANHFLEHTEDPVGTILTHLGKLKPGGVLFYAVPDKRYTFDHRREVTPVEHMVRDHEEGPAASRREHYDEYGTAVLGDEREREAPDFDERAAEFARRLESSDTSIHMHTFTAASFLALLLEIRERSEGAFEIEAVGRGGDETVVVLRRAGADPAPAAPQPSSPELAAEAARLGDQASGLELELTRTARELQRVKQSPSWRVTEPLRAAKARLGGRG